MSVFKHLPYLAIIGPVFILPGCASENGKFPTLERRPYETNTPLSTPVAVPVAAPVTLSAALQSKIDAMLARHRSANAQFNSGLSQVQTLAQNASSSAQGSENWVNAHMQLTRLDKKRSDSVAALGEIDALIAEQIDSDSVYVALLSDYQLGIAADVAKQTAEVERMARQIGE
jgi:alkylhydroperoxidase family enzyme